MDLSGRKVKVGEVHLGLQADIVLVRVFYVLYGQDLVQNPTLQIRYVCWVKFNDELLLLPILQG